MATRIVLATPNTAPRIVQPGIRAVMAALAAFCISSLLFAAVLGGIRHASGHGAHRSGAALSGIVVANSALPIPKPIPASSTHVADQASDRGHHDATDDAEPEPGTALPVPIPVPTPMLEPAWSGYLPAGQLSVRPVVLEDIDPDLRLAVPTPERAELIVQLLINEYGDVDRVVIEAGSLAAPVMAELEQGLKQMRFSPGRLYDKAVPAALRIEVILQAPLAH